MNAARRIIEEEGVEGVTVSAVVERAGSSVGSFYARFRGKDEFLLYLEARVWEEAERRWDQASASESWDSLSLEGIVRSVVALLVRIEEEDAGTRKALRRRSPRGELGAAARRFNERLAGDVARRLLGSGTPIAHPEPERATSWAYRLALGCVRELLGAGELESDEVVGEVTRAIVAYLTGGGPPPAEPGEVEFFDVWQ